MIYMKISVFEVFFWGFCSLEAILRIFAYFLEFFCKINRIVFESFPLTLLSQTIALNSYFQIALTSMKAIFHLILLSTSFLCFLSFLLPFISMILIQANPIFLFWSHCTLFISSPSFHNSIQWIQLDLFQLWNYLHDLSSPPTPQLISLSLHFSSLWCGFRPCTLCTGLYSFISFHVHIELFFKNLIDSLIGPILLSLGLCLSISLILHSFS